MNKATTPMRSKTTLYQPTLFLLLPFLFAGCAGPTVLKSDYVGYARDYGELSNKQLLLNLARLANDEPAFFLQLVGISSGYTMNQAVAVNPSATKNIPGYYKSAQSQGLGAIPPTGGDTVASSVGEYTKGALGVSGSLNVAKTESPIFQYTPITGSNYVQTAFYPIDKKVFYTFYDQGYPADWLARVMFENVQYVSSVHTNPPTTNTNAEFSINDVKDLTTIAAELTTGFNPVSTNVWNALSRPEQDLLEKSAQSPQTAKRAAAIIVKALNNIVEGPSISGVGPFKAVAVRPETRKFVDHGPDGADGYTQFVNRFVLEDAYPLALAATQRVTQTYTTNYAYLVNNPYDFSYPKFLAFCDGLLLAQLSHAVTVEKTPAKDGTPVYSGTNANLTDVAAAIQAKLDLKCDTSSGRITASKAPESAYAWSINTNWLRSGELVRVTPNEAKSGQFVDVAAAQQRTQFIRVSNYVGGYFVLGRPDFKMRTVEAAMFAAAKNELYFRDLADHPERLHPPNMCFVKDPVKGICAEVTPEHGPAFTVWPLLTLTREKWEPERLHRFVEITYPGPSTDSYFVADSKNKGQDRTVFTILTYLFAQTAISAENLPVQQTLRLQ